MTRSRQADGIQVDTVLIRNFRSLRDITVSLGRFTLLTGMNNAGKTSFLRALNLALGVDRRSVDADDFHVGAPSKDDGTSQNIVIDLRIVPVNAEGKRISSFPETWENTELGKLVRFYDKQAFVGLRTRVEFDEAKSEYVLKRYSLKLWRETTDWWEPDPAVEDVFTGKVDHIAVFYMNAQRDLVADLRNRSSYFGRMLSHVTFGDSQAEWEAELTRMNDAIVAASPELGHLAGELENLNQPLGRHGSKVTVTPLTRKLKDLVKGVNVEVKDGEGEGFTLDHHGMGTRSWAALLAYRAYVSWVTKQSLSTEDLPYHPVLALEEPEAHLHPNAQRQLCDQLREVPGQLIVSTHSPYIAALAPLEDLRHFAKSGSETHVRSVNVSGLGPEDLRRTQRDVMNTRGELLFARVIVLFEGDTEEQALPVFARHYFQQMPFELGITMVNVGGFGNYKAFLRLAVGMGIPWLIFSDAEVQTKQNVVAQTTGLTGGQVLFLPDGLDFEAYLLQEGYADVIRKAFVTLSLPPGADPRRRQAKEREASGMGTAELTQWLDANKPQAAPLVAESIVSLVDTAHQVPSRIRNMLDTLAGVLGVTGREGS